MKIEVYGPGCARCVATERNVRDALQQLGMNAEVEKVTEVEKFGKLGVVFTPAVAVNGLVKVSGKVPTVEEIKVILSGEKG